MYSMQKSTVPWLSTLVKFLLPANSDHGMVDAVEFGILDRLVVALGSDEHRELFSQLDSAAVKLLGKELNEVDEVGIERLAVECRDLWFRYIRLVGPNVLCEYFESPRVLSALGLRAESPFPHGSQMPEINFDLLEPVYNRGKIFRDVI
jgi:hypothetical protein